MARRTFFSFHYERDIWRATVVRNCWVTQDRQDVGFFDASLWEEAKRKGKEAIEAMIDRALDNTSVTVVLIGAETSSREYVGYEIKQSHLRGNGMLGIYINGILDQNRRPDVKGTNPFDGWTIQRNGRTVRLSEIYPTHDWVAGNGYQNCGTWIEAAAKAVGR
jgi:hypothetical protein